MSCVAPKTDSSFDISAQLKKCGLFKGLEESTIQHFADKAALHTAPKGKVLFIQDDEADYFYVIIQGWVKLFRETIEGAEAVIDVLTDGHIFGDTTVFENDQYGFSAEVVEQTHYIMLPTTMLKQAIEKNNQMAINMLSSMSQHRRQQNREIEHLNVQNAPQRIGCFLLRLCPIDMPETVTIHLPYDKTLIAARLGMKAETFSRALAKLKSETGILIKGPTVTINAPEKLIQFTCNQCSSVFPCEDLKD